MLGAHLGHEPALFQRLLGTLLQILVFEECANQWSLSRPLLPLILINQEYFNQWQEQARGRSARAGRRRAWLRARALTRAAPAARAPPVAPAQLIAQQAGTPERQAKLASAFGKLMADVQCNLESKNRDKITTNLTLFRHEAKALF